jgi:hypothetical protein
MDKTIREAFKNAVDLFETNKICNVSVLINDLNVKRKSYKYGYDAKYYTDDQRIGFFNRIFNRGKKAS